MIYNYVKPVFTKYFQCIIQSIYNELGSILE